MWLHRQNSINKWNSLISNWQWFWWTEYQISWHPYWWITLLEIPPKNINNRISRASFMIRQVKHFLPISSLRTLYFAMIHPFITYGILAWGHANPSLQKRTIILQKRAIRTINKASYNSHTEPLFKQSNIMKVNDQ